MSTFALWQPGRQRVGCWLENLSASPEPVSKGLPSSFVGDAGEQLEVISSSMADAAAGTGAQSVGLVYLDGTGALAFESVVPTGMSAAATTATDVAAVLGFFVETTGSGNDNAGALTLRKVSDAGDRAVIPAGANTWSPGQTAIPLGRQARLVGGQFAYGAGNNLVEIQIEADVNLHTGARTPGVFQILDRTETRRFAKLTGSPLLLPERTIVRARASSPGATDSIAGSFELEVTA